MFRQLPYHELPESGDGFREHRKDSIALRTDILHDKQPLPVFSWHFSFITAHHFFRGPPGRAADPHPKLPAVEASALCCRDSGKKLAIPVIEEKIPTLFMSNKKHNVIYEA